eukprot:Seg19563.1 transcript_id=Seg19563.1/GoldUCD/mRNA.D3Y31 product="hypothetical protein" protein_id=Seg19563.1/GoldUCD/D3Y31
MVGIALERGWGTFEQYEPIVEGLFKNNDVWLNGNNEAMTVREFMSQDRGWVFVKPGREKLFTGLVLNTSELIQKEKQFQDFVQCSTTNVKNIDDEVVMVSEPIKIDLEYRFFVFGNKALTGSTYGKDVSYTRVDNSHYMYQKMQDFLNANLAKDFTGVMDVTHIDGELRVVECNNMNSAGIYNCDPVLIANALLAF